MEEKGNNPVTNDEGLYIDESAFIDLNDAVEVKVDDTDVPMENDDDDDDIDEENADMPQELNVPTPDVSKCSLSSHSSSVYAVKTYYSKESSSLFVLTGGGDDKAFLHKICSLSSSITTQTVPLSHEHKDSVCAVDFNTKFLPNGQDPSKPGNYAAVGSYDGSIIIYDANTGEKLKTLDGPTDVEFLSFHPKGGSVLLAGSISDGTIWMYHLPTSKCLQVFVGHEASGEDGGGGVTAGCFTPDGKFAVSTGMDGTMRIWAPRSGMCKHIFRLIDDGTGLTCMAVNGGNDGQLAIAGGENGTAYVCHLQGKKLVASLRHFDESGRNMQVDSEEDEEVMDLRSIEAVAFAPNSVNSNWVATGGTDGSLKIWDLSHDAQCRQTCKISKNLESHDNDAGANISGITRLSWHPSLPLIFASYASGIVRLWDARDGTLLHSLTGGNTVDNQINDMAIEFVFQDGNISSAGTAIVVTANDDKSVKIYEVDIANVIATARSS